MPYTIQTIPAHRSNYGSVRNTGSIKYLVIHGTGNDGDSAVSNGNYFKNNIVKASAHYFIDDTYVIQSVPDNYAAWAVGGSKYADCAATGGGTHYGICTNTNSISLELCDTLRNGKLDFSEKTLENAAELAASIINRCHIPLENVIMHFQVNGKHCPAQFYNNRAAWDAFVERLKKNVTADAASSASSDPTKSLGGSISGSITQAAVNAAIQSWLNEYINAGLTSNGTVNAATKTALRKALQTAINECIPVSAVKLSVDGIIGPKSKAAIQQYALVKLGKAGHYVKVLEAFLYINGFDPTDFTGICTKDTAAAITQYQQSKKLSADGIAGILTWTALLS